MEELALTHQEKSELEDSEMLTDRHISAVNSLLEKQFPQIESLQTPLLLQNGSFKPISHEGRFMTEGLLELYTKFW